MIAKVESDGSLLNDVVLNELRESLAPLIGLQIPILKIPSDALLGFEPSQIGTVIGTLIDASLPQLDLVIHGDLDLNQIGLRKHEGILGDREGYPDYTHDSGLRVELKLLYVDPVGIEMKTPPTPREPSARITQKVTVKNVDPDKDVLLVIAYQLQYLDAEKRLCVPSIIDFEVFPMINCILARDQRLFDSGGRWFGDYETPAIPSKVGIFKKLRGQEIDIESYGRKASESKDFNEDTNFGKLKRIPYKPLQAFLMKHGASYSKRGNYPESWQLD